MWVRILALMAQNSATNQLSGLRCHKLSSYSSRHCKPRAKFRPPALPSLPSFPILVNVPPATRAQAKFILLI